MKLGLLQKSNWNLPRGFIIFATFICVLILVFDTINGRFWLNDFKVYYLASDAMIHGKTVYGTAFGLSSGFYKYSPFVLLLFAPFTLLTYSVASYIYFVITVIIVFRVFILTNEFLQKYFFGSALKHEGWMLSVVFIFILNLLFRELHLGNTNIFLLYLNLLVIKQLLKSKYFYAGVLFGLVLLFKPFFIVLALPILLHKKWKIIIGGASFMLFQLLIVLIIFGWSTTYLMHQEWVKTMFDHSSAFPSNNTIVYLIKHFINPEISSFFQYYVMLAVIIFYVGLHGLLNYFPKSESKLTSIRNTNYIFESLVLLAILPNILNTDTEHFLYSLPLIAILVCYVFQQKSIIWFICIFILFMLFGTNSNDMVGKAMADFYERNGTLGISNLMIVVLTVLIYYSKIKKAIFINNA